MNPQHDDIDDLIRKSFDGPLPDEGFSDRLMQRLSPRRRRSVWPLWAGVLTGTVLYALSVFGSPLWRTGWQAWLAGDGAGSSVIVLSTMAALVLLALVWGLTEADDH